MARGRWATGVVALVAIAAGGGGAAYLWREATNTDDRPDGGLVSDASVDARAGRGKAKSAKRGGRTGKPRVGVRTGSGQGGHGGTGGAVAGGGPAMGGTDDDQGDDGSGDEAPENFQPPFRGRGPAGPTYEAVLASNNQEVTIGAKTAPDLTDAQLSGPMHDGAFVGECGAPDRMKVTVKVAVKMGHAAGVSISTTPSDPDIAGCIDRYVRTFAWPSSPKLDSFTTTY